MDRGDLGGLESIRSQRLGHDWVTNTYTHSLEFTSNHLLEKLQSDFRGRDEERS